MSTGIAVREETQISSQWMFDVEAVTQIQRVAKMFCASTLVPKEYQGGEHGLANCVIALNMAYRMKADPLMVMQNLYVVHGRPSWSSQFLIACFNQTGRFAPIRYRWSGQEGTDSWGCQAYSTDLTTKDPIEGPMVTIKMSKDEGWYAKNGSKWKTIPRLMLMYRAAAWMVRTHAPELAMGLQTKEEAEDIVGSNASLPSGSRLDVMADILGGDADKVIDATVEPDTTNLSEFAPRENEDSSKYLKRLRQAIASAGSDETLTEIIGEAGKYAGGDLLPEDKYVSLNDLANKRIEEIEAAKANGQLV